MSDASANDELDFDFIMGRKQQPAAPKTPADVPSRALPSFTYAGIEQAKAAVEEGSVDLETLLANTKADHERRYGVGNVRPVYARGNRFVDFEIKRGDKWESSGSKAYFNEVMQDIQKRFVEEHVDPAGPGAGWTPREEAGVKMTPEGKFAYLVSRYGQQNVQPFFDENGELTNFLFRERPEEKFRFFDKPSEALKPSTWEKEDLADLSGDAIESLPGAVGSAAGALIGSRFKAPAKGAAFGGMVGDALGSVARQAYSDSLPGDDKMGTGDRVQAAAFNVAAGLAGEGVSKLVAKGVRAIRPTTSAAQEIVASRVPRTLDELRAGKSRTGVEAFRESADLEARTGVPLSLGQRTGSPKTLRFEASLKQNPDTIDVQRLYDSDRLEKFATFVDKTINATGGGRVGAAEAGQRVAAAYNSYVEELAGQRAAKAAEMFGRASQLAGHQRVLPLRNTLETMREITEASRGFGPDEAAAVKSYLEKKLGELDDVMSPDEFNRSLHNWGKAARKGDEAATGISRSESSRISARIFGAMQRDLDDAIATGGVAGEAAGALREARDVYKQMSAVIEDADTKVFQRALGLDAADEASKLPGKLLSGDVSPESITKAMTILEKTNPQSARGLRSAVLQEMVERSSKRAPTDAPVEDATELGVSRYLSPADFANLISKNRERLLALFGGDAKSKLMLADAGRVATKLASRDAAVGSTTFTNIVFGKAMKAAGSIVPSPLREAYGSTVGKLNPMRPERLVHILNDPKQMELFLKIAEPPPTSTPREIVRWMSQLAALQTRDDVLESYNMNQAEVANE